MSAGLPSATGQCRKDVLQSENLRSDDRHCKTLSLFESLLTYSGSRPATLQPDPDLM